MRKPLASLAVLGLGVGLGLAAVVASAPMSVAPVRAAAPPTPTPGQMKLRLSSVQAGVMFDGDTLVCPAVLISASSGARATTCEFTIESTGDVAPTSVVVSVSASGMTLAQMSARKFAVVPHTGPPIYLTDTPQALYSFSGSQLPVTVAPGLVWGADAGLPLDNSDLGTTMLVTFTVVAEAVGGATASPVATPTSTVKPTPTPLEVVGGETHAPVPTSSPPPTGSTLDAGRDAAPAYALLACLLLAAAGLAAGLARRRSSSPRR